MSGRWLSVQGRAAAFAQETGEAFIVLVKISHALLEEPILCTSDIVPTVHDGETYQPYPFSVELPEDSGDEQTQTRLQIDNVSQQITEAALLIQDPPEVDLRVVLASTPDVLEAGPFVCSMNEIEGDALVISGSLSYEPLLDEDFPGDSMDPVNCPGLFAQ